VVAGQYRAGSWQIMPSSKVLFATPGKAAMRHWPLCFEIPTCRRETVLMELNTWLQ